MTFWPSTLATSSRRRKISWSGVSRQQIAYRLLQLAAPMRLVAYLAGSRQLDAGTAGLTKLEIHSPSLVQAAANAAKMHSTSASTAWDLMAGGGCGGTARR